jgi:signal transduction histidine kinase
MIDDLLVIAKRRAGKKTSPVFMPLGEVAGRITRTFEDEARRKGLSLVVEIPDDMRTVRADLEVLEPVLENLLSNAFKYTREGRVLVRFELAGNDLKFTVEDTGIGIPREDRPKLFTEFFRAKNAKAVEEIGNGLGLALVKQTLNQHHGRIEVESEEGRGTRFVVFLTFQIG